ncbi:MAG: ABC transporter permease [Lachnospiraceae bacterium]|nr:ABC transporter permease [Lachnospiraceae bacterium]
MKKISQANATKQVFSFTLTQQLNAKSYRTITILLAVIFFLLPAIIMPCVEAFGKHSAKADEPSPVTEVYVVDNTPVSVDFNFLSQMGNVRFSGISYIDCGDDLDHAKELADANPTSLILAIDTRNNAALANTEYAENVEMPAAESGTYRFNLLRTDECDISKNDARALEDYINLYFRLVLSEKAGISYETLAALSVPVVSQTTHVTADGLPAEDENQDPDDPLTAMKPALSMFLPYVNMMLLYFLVLFYGQGVANCVIMEKTSKLMDTFLVSVKPAAMVFGKVFAIITASVLQFVLWILALVGGFAAGSALVKMINPQSDMMLLAFFDLLGNVSGMFTVPGVILALLMVIGAFALYCGLAAIGGSLASKPEDLSSTNGLFTLVLIVSFFAVISSGAVTGNMPETVAWYDYVPFTSILVTPSRVLLGYVSIPTACISLALVLACVVLCLAAAGKVYRMMSLYKGNPPKPAALIGMLKNK